MMAGTPDPVTDAWYVWAALLSRGDSFMSVVAEMSGLTVAYQLLAAVERTPRDVAPEIALALSLSGDEQLQVRAGELRAAKCAGGSLLAHVAATVVLSRLTSEEEAQLLAGSALGVVLYPHGVRRYTRFLAGPRDTKNQVGLWVEAELRRGTVPVALTTEVVPLSIFTTLAARSAGATS